MFYTVKSCNDKCTKSNFMYSCLTIHQNKYYFMLPYRYIIEYGMEN